MVTPRPDDTVTETTSFLSPSPTEPLPAWISVTLSTGGMVADRDHSEHLVEVGAIASAR